VGEMRDTETAQIGLRAVMTGHLVFSTLHTRDAAGTLSAWWTWNAEVSGGLCGASGAGRNACCAAYAKAAARRMSPARRK